jgi:CDP-diacylglycerol--glycerol-3-phosphate 3-phosphatidyltransferase
LFDGRWRSSVEKGLKPVGSGLRRSGIAADHLTGLGLLLACACAFAIGTGHLGLGLGLLIAAAVPDMLDGAVAKASGTASPRGAFFDSVADRVSDSLVLGGIAWYLADTRGGQAAMLPFAVLGASTLISYERAKAESLGYSARGGLMERAERIIALCFGLAFSDLLVPILWLMLGLTLVTAGQRFVKVWRQATAPRPTESRWRTWREAAAVRRSSRPVHRVSDARRSRRRAGTRP